MWGLLLFQKVFPIVFPLLVEGGLRALGYHNPPLAYALFAIAFVFLVWFTIDWWKHKDRYQTLHLQVLIGSIPTILDALHEKRGIVVTNYVRKASKRNDFKALENMGKELDPFLGGGEKLHDMLANTLTNVEGGAEMLSVFEELIPQDNKQPKIELTDYETARLIANSAKTHLPIEDMLNGQKMWKFRRLKKSLDSARNKLPGTMAVKATEAIDHYLTCSEAYWAVKAVLLSVRHLIREIPMPQEAIAQMETAYNLYEDIFQKLMNVNKAKVCEVINDYTLQTWDKVREK
jgi:hypothetical protein